MLHTLLFTLVIAQTPQKATLGLVLDEVSKSSGIHVVAQPFLSKQLVDRPTEPITDKTIEAYLKQLAIKLPVQANIVKLNLPPPPKGAPWSADDLLGYALAEAKLFRRIIGEPRSDYVEVIAQQLPPDRATPVVQALNLKPVYVLMMKHAYFAGVWQTTYGEMRLTQTGSRVSGTYTTGNGRVEGNVVGMELRFTWFEQDANGGGYGTLRMSEDGMSFSGPWWNDTNPDQQAGTWTGKRIG